MVFEVESSDANPCLAVLNTMFYITTRLHKKSGTMMFSVFTLQIRSIVLSGANRIALMN